MIDIYFHSGKACRPHESTTVGLWPWANAI